MKRIYVIERQDIEQIIKDKIKSLLESNEFRNLLVETITPEYMSATKAAEFICSSKGTLYVFVKHGFIHAHQVS